MSTETLTVPNDHTPLDKLLFTRFGREVPGLVEQTLAQNPGLAALGVFPPRGTKVIVTVPAPVSSITRRSKVQLYA